MKVVAIRSPRAASAPTGPFGACALLRRLGKGRRGHARATRRTVRICRRERFAHDAVAGSFSYTTLHGALTVPIAAPPMTLVPFISHSATAPLVLCSRMSALPSPLKSENRAGDGTRHQQFPVRVCARPELSRRIVTGDGE
jgi:hypothetical protein